MPTSSPGAMIKFLLTFCLSLVYSASTIYEKTCWKAPLGESSTRDKPHTNISRDETVQITELNHFLRDLKWKVNKKNTSNRWCKPVDWSCTNNQAVSKGNPERSSSSQDELKLACYAEFMSYCYSLGKYFSKWPQEQESAASIPYL